MKKQTTVKKEERKRCPAAVVLEILVLAALTAGALLALRAGYHHYMRAAYPLKYSEYVEQYADQYGFSPSLVYAVIRTESEFDPDIVSYKEAKGLMQITDDTFDWAQSKSPEKEDLPPETLFDPQTNIHYGVFIMRLLSDQFENPDTMLAAYNAGAGSVTRWLRDPAYSQDGKTLYDMEFQETVQYVERVREAQKMYQTLYGVE